MKKILAAFFAVAMLITGCGGDKPAEPGKDVGQAKIGVISHMNASEVEYNELMNKLERMYKPAKASISAEYIYFDKMNDMQLAIESGQIDMLSTYENVADYMIKRSADKEILPSERHLEDSFCFALREGDTILKNNLNKAIKAMTADGTLKNLTKEYILNRQDDAEPPAVPITKIDGADTIKVAVTGDLPPFDLVLADGTPAGFVRNFKANRKKY